MPDPSHPFVDAPAATHPLSQASDSRAAKISFAPGFPLRILIADDTYINRRILSLMLKRLGHEVDSVQNGLECLDAALNRTYDLIFMDINMPHMDGIECASGLRKIGLDVAIYAVTANLLGNILQPCLEAGMNGCLAKPVALEDIKTVLQRVSAEKAARSFAVFASRS